MYVNTFICPLLSEEQLLKNMRRVFLLSSVCVSPSGLVHSAIVQRFLQILPPTCAKPPAWMNLVRAEGTARRVELVCVTIRSSMKDPTASTTGLSVNDTEASSAMVQRNCRSLYSSYLKRCDGDTGW